MEGEGTSAFAVHQLHPVPEIGLVQSTRVRCPASCQTINPRGLSTALLWRSNEIPHKITKKFLHEVRKNISFGAGKTDARSYRACGMTSYQLKTTQDQEAIERKAVQRVVLSFYKQS